MNFKFSHLVLLVIAIALIGGTQMSDRKPTEATKKVSLKSGDKEITAISLKNTHSRSYEDDFSHNRCDLTAKAEGVIWMIVCEGKDIPVAAISLKDEQGRKFTRTCWNSQGTINDIEQTSFIAFGPDDSKSIRVFLNDASVEIEIPRAPRATN